MTTSDIQALIAKQRELIVSLKKRLSGIDAMLAQGQQERNNLVADVISAVGKLDGLEEAAGKQALSSTWRKEIEEAEQKPDA